MVRYILRRLVYNVLILFGILFIVFAVARLSPVDPVRYVLSTSGRSFGNVDPVEYAAMRHRLGLDRPIPVQFIEYVRNVAQGNFGESIINPGRSVSDILRRGIPVSIELAGMGLFGEVAVGTLLGALAAGRQNSLFDRTAMAVAIVAGAIPILVWGVVLIVVFGIKLRWLPIQGWSGPRYWILPVLTISITGVSIFARFARASIIDQIRMDFVRTAQAKGLHERRILFGHILRNAAVPILTFVGPAFALVITGNFIVETMFGIPGIAYYSVTSAIHGDYPIIQATVLIFSFMVMSVNLAIDLAYGFIDPRIRIY